MSLREYPAVIPSVGEADLECWLCRCGGWYYMSENLICLYGWTTDIDDIIDIVTHESIHWILHDFINKPTSRKFDNLEITGNAKGNPPTKALYVNSV